MDEIYYDPKIQSWNHLDEAPRLVFILILYLSNSTKQQILGRQCYLEPLRLSRDLTGGDYQFKIHLTKEIYKNATLSS